MTKTLALVAGSMLAASGCIPTVTDDLSTVEKPRLLAVATSPAEAAPGAAVTFSALVAVAPGARRAPVDWALCVDRKPLTELGAVSSACLHPGESDASTVEFVGRGDEIPSAVPRDSCSLFGPNPPPPKNPTDPGGRPVDPDPTGGFYQPVLAFLSGEPALGAIRLSCGIPGLSPDQRVELGNRYRLNENPRLDSVMLGDGTEVLVDAAAEPVAVSRGAKLTFRAEWAACPRKSVCGDGVCGEREDVTSCPDDCSAGASNGCTGAETYAFYDASADKVVDRREGIAITWYSTGGDFSSRRVGVAEGDPDSTRVETKWTAPSTAAEHSFWAVIRDDRGGVSWTTFRLRVR